ncbi:uncharacterized protein CANTADRAFT_49651 [Suhomyces tanzawaensis NRRL Y-17324]|uniref:U6 snRNA phosphodiesterase n=1 Tax=Suhomyces tanzawaensis NRRL Y-17324 TaxID=984487 RepID=A0A1E4SL58_9ASCO|nr:uncharacterized protein CANTADRAFT_49651 [Suhomyces tanzawaensis NRRL Y-17324]ODV80239.1 hypothetical protein CANTADRAFT_49651 [Suhomyces tanzawaensis NRRL Y-17324]
MNHIQEYSSDSELASDEEQSSRDIDDINIFLQNYAENMLNRGSIFLYIPWRPSASALNLMHSQTKKAMSRIPIASKYSWSDIGKVSPLRYHISIYPNIEGDDYKIEQLKDNLKHSFQNLEIDDSLVGFDEEEVNRYQRVKGILGQAASPKKYVRLKFEPHLRVFKSTKKDTLFLAGVIDINASSGRFFERIRDSIFTNANSLSLIERKPKMPIYHISFQLGELKSTVSEDEIEEFNCQLEDLDIGLESINVYVSDIIINSIGTFKLTKSIQLNI